MDRPVENLTALPPMGKAFVRALMPGRGRDAGAPPQQVRVTGVRQDRARLADYSRVCGFTLRDSVPATWLHVLTFPLHIALLSDPKSAVKLVGAVHVSNRMTLHRPVDASEELELRVHSSELRPHKRGGLIDMIGEVLVDGETVWDGVSTYLTSGVRVPGEPAEEERLQVDAGDPHARWRLGADLGRHYRRVSGDPNLIHTSRVAARAFGFSRPIIHGMWTHARALAALEGRLPEAYTASVNFIRPIMLPGTVAFASSSGGDGIDAAVTTRDGAKPLLTMRVQTAA